jgi:hypothetical protein
MATHSHRILINAPKEEVFEAITTEQGLQGWYTPTTEGGAGHGEQIKLHFKPRMVHSIGTLKSQSLGRSCAGNAWKVQGPPLERRLPSASMTREPVKHRWIWITRALTRRMTSSESATRCGAY